MYPNNSAVHVKLHYNCPTTKCTTATVGMQGMCQNKCGLSVLPYAEHSTSLLE